MDSHFDTFHFLEEADYEEGQPMVLKGGLSLEKSMKTGNPTVSRFKDLIVPIGLVLDNRKNNVYEDIIGELKDISETMFDNLFSLANGICEQSKTKPISTRDKTE